MTEKSERKEQIIENNMHDKCKHVVMFHNNLCKFLRALKGVLPEYAGAIKVAVDHYKSMSRASYLKEVHALLTPHIQHVSEYDEGIFTSDYGKDPLYLLPQLDFREIWNLLDGEDFQSETELQEATKKSIFNHLQTIYVSCEMALDQVQLFNKNIEKQKTFLMNMLDNLKLDETLKERIAQMKEEEASAEKNNDSGFSMSKLAELFGEDNLVYKVAKEVADELDLGKEDIDNPVDAITELFANDGRKLRDLIVTVTDKIEQKVQSGEVDKEILINDARKMKDKLSGFIGKIPGLEDMLNNNEMINQIRTQYEGLTVEKQKHYLYVPELLDKPLLEWDDEEKAHFDEFVKYLAEHQGNVGGVELGAEEELPETTAAPQKPTPRAQRPKKNARPKKNIPRPAKK